jgi:D-glutamate N-acetyltransferase
MKIEPPYLLFLGNATDDLAAKTASGIAHWTPEKCLGQYRLEGCTVSLGLPDLSLEDAYRQGAKTLIIGVANRGGVISEEWIAHFKKAIVIGFDIANGLHHSLSDHAELVATAKTHGRKLIDVRHPDKDFPIATGKKRSGKRVLTVGTDCSVGKMYTSLTLARAMKDAGMDATFRATGQTGIFIEGNGISVDAVIADFIAGSIEDLTPDNTANHWDVIEGQGSVFHPSFAGVSLGLLHGAQPDAMILCHELGRPHMRGVPGFSPPELNECVELHEKMARLTNPNARCIAVSLNTSRLNDSEKQPALQQITEQTGLLCFDPNVDLTVVLKLLETI